MSTDRVDTGTEFEQACIDEVVYGLDRMWLSTKPASLNGRRLQLAISTIRRLDRKARNASLFELQRDQARHNRDTLRTQLDRAKEAMNTAIVKIDDGSPHHARGVLDAALGEMEVEG